MTIETLAADVHLWARGEDVPIAVRMNPGDTASIVVIRVASTRVVISVEDEAAAVRLLRDLAAKAAALADEMDAPSEASSLD